MKTQAALAIPVEHGARLGVGDGAHPRVERRLAEAFLEHAGAVQQFVGDDGVVHPHAALVEHAHDRLLAPEFFCKLPAGLARSGGHFQLVESANVRCVVFDFPLPHPIPQRALEEGVVEVLAPDRGVFHAGFGERTVEVQHPDQPRPGAAPVRHREDRAAMREQPVQQVMRVLPHRLGNDQRRVGRDVFENFHSVFLAVDEAVLFFRIERMAALHRPSLALDGGDDDCFHGGLRRPAFLVRGQTQVAAGDEVGGFHLGKRCSVVLFTALY